MALTKVSSSLVKDDAVTSAHISDGGIATADIANNAVTSNRIAQNSILTKHIGDGQVTTSQLGADAVTAAKIADDAISEEHLDITVITSLTEVTAATGDLLMVADISDSNALKKIPVSSILAGTHTGPIGSGSNAVNVGTVTATGNLSMATDNATIFIGADLDLRVLHTGSAGQITNNTGDLTLDVAGDIILDAAGSDVIYKRSGTSVGEIQVGDDNFNIRSLLSDKDIIFKGNDGGSVITALTLDMSDAGTAYFNHDIRLVDNGQIVFGSGGDASLYHTGSAMTLNQTVGDLTLDVAGDIVLDADGGDIWFNDGGTAIGVIKNSSSHLFIESTVQDKDILIRGNDGGSTITAVEFDMSAAGAATFNSKVGIGASPTRLFQVTSATEDGTSLIATYNANTNPDSEQFYIEHNGSEVALGNKRNKLTLEAVGAIELDATGDITLDADGQDVLFKDGGTQFGSIRKNGNNIQLMASIQDGDITFHGDDGGSAITALTLDMSDSGTAIFNSWAKFGDTNRAVFGAGSDLALYSDGTNAVIKADNGYLNLDSSSTIILDAGNAEIHFHSSGSIFGKTYVSGGDFYFNNPTQDKDIVFAGDDGGSSVEALRIDMSEGGAATFNGTLSVNNVGADKKYRWHRTGGKSFSLEHDTTGFYFYNETDSALMTRFLDAGKVGIRENSPSAALTVKGLGGGDTLSFQTKDNSGNETFWIADGGSAGTHYQTFYVGKESSDSGNAWLRSGEFMQVQGPVASGYQGRYIHNWWGPKISGNGSSWYHLKTNMWGGGSPHGNTEYIMGGFIIKGYRYASGSNMYKIHQFHNWSGGLHNDTIDDLGSWTGDAAVYISSDGWVTLRIKQSAYHMYTIDFVQYSQYNKIDTSIQSETSSNASAI